MFIPLYDGNKLKHIRFQWVTLIIVVVNVVIWLLMEASGEQSTFNDVMVLGLGYIPSVAHDLNVLSDELVIVPTWLTYVSYSFVHGGFLHLAGNMAFLWIFSDNVEDAMGHTKFIVFYALCAVAGAVMHGILFPSSDSPLIGASGAASGIVAAYLLLHPRVSVWVLVLGRVPLPLPSYIVLTLWILYQFFMLFYDLDGAVAWGGHVGGIIAGAILIVFMKRSDVKLFAKPVVSPVVLDDPDAAGPPIG